MQVFVQLNVLRGKGCHALMMPERVVATDVFCFPWGCDECWPEGVSGFLWTTERPELRRCARTSGKTLVAIDWGRESRVKDFKFCTLLGERPQYSRQASIL